MPTLKKTCCRGQAYLQRPDRVFNADETGIQPLSGQKVVAERGAKHVFQAAAANAKQSLTCVAWGSADGQVLAPNYISAGTMLTADALGGVAFFPDSAIILKPGTHMMDGQLFPKLLVSMARQIPGGVSKRNRALLLLDGHGSRFSSETRDTAAALGFDMLILLAPHKPPQAPCSSQEATQPADSEPGPSTPPPAKRSKRTKAEHAAESTQPTKGKGEAA
ncbi:hypothetical protein QJQ45_000143 [Haematococcus lacustris]|nr:hypothetical protein QJQ45_000143 [Haematococcus lacustris]